MRQDDRLEGTLRRINDSRREYQGELIEVKKYSSLSLGVSLERTSLPDLFFSKYSRRNDQLQR